MLLAMKIADIVRNFIHKAKQEASKGYNLAPVVNKSTSSSAAEKKEYIKEGWIGVDLDGTLAYSDPQSSMSKIGEPVPKMVNLVIQLSNEGFRVKIFTARASDAKQIPLVHKWLRDNGLPEFEITNIKDYEMIRLYDDRAIQVIPNTGELVESLK